MAKSPRGSRKGITAGLKQGMRQFVNTPGVWSKFPEINAALQASDLPTIEEMDAHLERSDAEMRRRGVIRDEDELRAAMALVDDPESGSSEKQRRKLGAMAAAHELYRRTDPTGRAAVRQTRLVAGPFVSFN